MPQFVAYNSDTGSNLTMAQAISQLSPALRLKAQGVLNYTDITASSNGVSAGKLNYSFKILDISALINAVYTDIPEDSYAKIDAWMSKLTFQKLNSSTIQPFRIQLVEIHGDRSATWSATETDEENLMTALRTAVTGQFQAIFHPVANAKKLISNGQINYVLDMQMDITKLLNRASLEKRRSLLEDENPKVYWVIAMIHWTGNAEAISWAVSHEYTWRQLSSPVKF